jgi:hypothetical protein
VDRPPGLDWSFVRGALVGIVLGVLLWAGFIWLLVRLFG